MKKIILSLLVLCMLTACADVSHVDTTEVNYNISDVVEQGTKHDLGQFEEYELDEVIDGDTIRIQYNGRSEKVRFLLIDTPETNHETLGEQPYGPEAKEFVKELLADEETVFLQFDVSKRDKYDRLLAYIYTKDGISVQEQLLKTGLARVAYIYEPNTLHVDWFKSIQETAKEKKIGVWSVENYVTNRGYDKSVFNQPKELNTSENEETDSSCMIKGNINSKGVKIYHSPGQKDYEATKAEEMFCTPEEAEEAGFKAASQ